MSDKLFCRNCKLTKDKKNFGYIQSTYNIKKFGENHLCMLCYYKYPTVTQEEVVKHFELQAENEYGW